MGDELREYSCLTSYWIKQPLWRESWCCVIWYTCELWQDLTNTHEWRQSRNSLSMQQWLAIESRVTFGSCEHFINRYSHFAPYNWLFAHRWHSWDRVFNGKLSFSATTPLFHTQFWQFFVQPSISCINKSTLLIKARGGLRGTNSPHTLRRNTHEERSIYK